MTGVKIYDPNRGGREYRHPSSLDDMGLTYPTWQVQPVTETVLIMDPNYPPPVPTA